MRVFLKIKINIKNLYIKKKIIIFNYLFFLFFFRFKFNYFFCFLSANLHHIKNYFIKKLFKNNIDFFISKEINLFIVKQIFINIFYH
jgi:hypothetical protein